MALNTCNMHYMKDICQSSVVFLHSAIKVVELLVAEDQEDRLSRGLGPPSLVAPLDLDAEA